MTLIDVMPSLRNELAHGSPMLHNNALASLRICADFINQLFEQPDFVRDQSEKSTEA
ncbi:hypothetical protein [Thioalkalivibrio sulfidiphilus]|uniref:hypothetical protein n=1 Tax=Thioalkalivibrio sulfidiphilus TaxID=1033854 RepID=UPI003B39BAB0